MKSGTIAVVGRSNAGKSTLINVLVGEKVAIVSPKPQTTRDRILGILTTDNYQMIFEDTPGFYRANSMLNKKMQKTARQTTDDVDLIMYVLDCHDELKENDVELLKTVVNRGTEVILVLSKIDIMTKDLLIENLSKLACIDGVSEVIPVSARKGKNIHELLELLQKYLPERDKLIEEDIVSDKSEKFMISEIMREKILLKFDKEIPHGVAIVINTFELNERGVYEISLDIVCEKENHKAILIGKQGKAIKEVSSFAREGMEKFLGKKVFLTTYVKVKEDWRDKENLLEQFGYGDKDKFI